MSEGGFDVRRNGLGLLLFALGAFFAVLLIKAFTSDVPVADAGGTAALAALWIDSIGGLAGLVFVGGIALLGARMFLGNEPVNAVRHAGGLAGIGVGLSILAGSVSADAGGALGRAIGGGITGATHVAIGALVGIGVMAFAIWGVWLQGARIPRQEIDQEIPDDGVTAEEAAALIPTESNRTLEGTRKTERASTWTAPPSPYPEDVRRRGEIPAGAKPLDTTHVHTTAQSGAQASSVYRWTAARTDEPADAAREDLARAVDTEPDIDDVEDEELALDLPEPRAQALIAEKPVEEVLEAEVIEDELLDPVSEIPASRVEPLPDIPRPSWEQSSLFEEADEPVDAYGTPLSLVGEIVERTREAEPAAKVDVNQVQAFEEVVEEDEEDGEDDSDEEEYDEYEDDDSEEEDEEEDADEEVEDGAYAEDDEEGVEEEEESPLEVARSESASGASSDARSLKDVVLTPQAAASPRAPNAPALPADRHQLLVDAGCLFLDRGRVAVSMLQREYSMDFDEACKVLDELQELGLIGPYMGGQRRDILLTRDQWLEKVASS